MFLSFHVVMSMRSGREDIVFGYWLLVIGYLPGTYYKQETRNKKPQTTNSFYYFNDLHIVQQRGPSGYLVVVTRQSERQVSRQDDRGLLPFFHHLEGFE